MKELVRQPGGLRADIDYGPSRGRPLPGGTPSGGPIVGRSGVPGFDRSYQVRYERAYEARQAARLNDVAFLRTAEGQEWLAALNRDRDVQRRKALR